MRFADYMDNASLLIFSRRFFQPIDRLDANEHVRTDQQHTTRSQSNTYTH